jgi:hypothetical protein
MQVLAALGDAPTATIAVVAILIGVFLAARGPREKRGAGADEHAEASGPTLLRVPVASAPDAEADVEPGFVGPQGEVVGHGRIRLGATGPLGGGEPAAAQAASAPVAPEPVPEPEPEPEPPAPEVPAAEPRRLEASPAASEQALFTSPPTLPEPPTAAQDAAAEPPAAPDPPPPAADADADAAKEPAWRVAARAANSAVHFRQGAIKLGGKRADERKDQD